MILVVQTQNFPDSFFQIGYMIAVSLLTKTAEAVDILANLRRRKVHPLAQLLGRNAHYARLLQLAQMAVIHRQPANYCVRNPRFVSHGYFTP